MLRALGDHPSTAWAVPALETTTVRQVFHAVTVGGVGVHDLALVERSGSGRLAVRVPNVEGDPHERILPLPDAPDQRAHRPMVDVFAATVRVAQAAAPRFMLEAGEALLIDNWRVSHGREGFSDLSRLLWRVWCWTGSGQRPEGVEGRDARRDFEV